jgi:hypothetical protein
VEAEQGDVALAVGHHGLPELDRGCQLTRLPRKEREVQGDGKDGCDGGVIGQTQSAGDDVSTGQDAVLADQESRARHAPVTSTDADGRCLEHGTTRASRGGPP